MVQFYHWYNLVISICVHCHIFPYITTKENTKLYQWCISIIYPYLRKEGIFYKSPHPSGNSNSLYISLTFLVFGNPPGISITFMGGGGECGYFLELHIGEKSESQPGRHCERQKFPKIRHVSLCGRYICFH